VQCGDTHKTAPPRGDGAGFAWRLLASFRPGSLPGPGLLGEIRRASLPKLEQRAPREPELKFEAAERVGRSWVRGLEVPPLGWCSSGVVGTPSPTLLERLKKKKWKGYASVGACPAVLNRPGPRAEKDERRGYQ
jgi:hypothetical protein